MARPKIEWSDKDYKTFEGLCGIQCTVAEIESVMGIRHETIDRLCKEHYTDETGKKMGFSQVYKKYSSGGKISLRRSQFRLAEKNAAMAIWLGKQYLNQKDAIEDTGENAADDGFVDALREVAAEVWREE